MNLANNINALKAKFPFGDKYVEGHIEAYHTISFTAMKYLKEGSKILDFGAGPCDKVAILQTLGFQTFSFDDYSDYWHKQEDNFQKIEDFAKVMGVSLTSFQKDGYLPFEKNSFDMVMMHDVLEHLHNSPRELLNDLIELLKPNGYLFLTVPNAVNIRKRLHVLFGKTNLPAFDSFYWYPGDWRGHIREYVEDDLEKLVSYLGLSKIELKSCHHMSFKIPSILRGVYKLSTIIFPGWRDTWLLLGRKTKDWVPKRDLSDSEKLKMYGYEQE
jgi:SAM-dependent methyltransferase